ncbi:L,D-transpeptidase family protein [Metabacillus fastidiosus]|uniref:L,D-transpeptidase family protein n=1 Tax=Metabacillus fastidiosus TaxID=1458 RepID=UPI002E1E54AB|nr:L,D-transpeptidase family protein [Metabacillus fastidiosus]MED4534416.1 L,D-transpeptidase family protein [Metabacillus fastidiosus]
MKKLITLFAVVFLFLSVIDTASAASNSFDQAFQEEEQLIVVTVKNAKDTKATVETYEKINGSFTKVLGPIPAVVGKGGVSVYKKEGDGKTPAGIYGLGTAFGSVKKPAGMVYTYRQTGKEDYWIDDPSSSDYNKWVRYSGDPNKKWRSYERMLQELYKYGVHIRYNDDPIVKGKGSAIFLHVWRNSSSPTAGCVAVSEQNARNILLWLNEKKNPQIIISEQSALEQLLNEKELSNVKEDLKKGYALSSSLNKQYSLIQSKEDLEIKKVYSEQYNELRSVMASINKGWGNLTSKEQSPLYSQYSYVNNMYNRTAAYIDAVNGIKKGLEPKQAKLIAALNKGILDASTVQTYDEYSQLIKKSEVNIGKVYGSSIRRLLLDEYIMPAKITKESIIYEVSIYLLLEKIETETDEVKRELEFKKLDRLKQRAKDIKEQGNKLHPGKYPTHAEINEALLMKEKILREK